MKVPKTNSGKFISPSHATAADQERKVAAKFGVQPTVASGRFDKKGDSGAGYKDLVRIDNKGTVNKSYRLELAVFEELAKASLGYGQIPVIEVSFKDKKGQVIRSVCIIDTDELASLVRAYNEKS